MRFFSIASTLTTACFPVEKFFWATSPLLIIPIIPFGVKSSICRGGVEGLQNQGVSSVKTYFHPVTQTAEDPMLSSSFSKRKSASSYSSTSKTAKTTRIHEERVNFIKGNSSKKRSPPKSPNFQDGGVTFNSHHDKQRLIKEISYDNKMYNFHKEGQAGHTKLKSRLSKKPSVSPPAGKVKKLIHLKKKHHSSVYEENHSLDHENDEIDLSSIAAYDSLVTISPQQSFDPAMFENGSNSTKHPSVVTSNTSLEKDSSPSMSSSLTYTILEGTFPPQSASTKNESDSVSFSEQNTVITEQPAPIIIEPSSFVPEPTYPPAPMDNIEQPQTYSLPPTVETKPINTTSTLTASAGGVLRNFSHPSEHPTHAPTTIIKEQQQQQLLQTKLHDCIAIAEGNAVTDTLARSFDLEFGLVVLDYVSPQDAKDEMETILQRRVAPIIAGCQRSSNNSHSPTLSTSNNVRKRRVLQQEENVASKYSIVNVLFSSPIVVDNPAVCSIAELDVTCFPMMTSIAVYYLEEAEDTNVLQLYLLTTIFRKLPRLLNQTMGFIEIQHMIVTETTTTTINTTTNGEDSSPNGSNDNSNANALQQQKQQPNNSISTLQFSNPGTIFGFVAVICALGITLVILVRRWLFQPSRVIDDSDNNSSCNFDTVSENLKGTGWLGRQEETDSALISVYTTNSTGLQEPVGYYVKNTPRTSAKIFMHGAEGKKSVASEYKATNTTYTQECANDDVLNTSVFPEEDDDIISIYTTTNSTGRQEHIGYYVKKTNVNKPEKEGQVSIDTGTNSVTDWKIPVGPQVQTPRCFRNRLNTSIRCQPGTPNRDGYHSGGDKISDNDGILREDSSNHACHEANCVTCKRQEQKRNAQLLSSYYSFCNTMSERVGGTSRGYSTEDTVVL